MDNVFQMGVFVANSHLRPSSQTVPVSPERPSGPPSTCQAHPLFPSASSAEPAAHPPTERNTKESQRGYSNGQHWIFINVLDVFDK